MKIEKQSVSVIWVTPDPEKAIESAGRTCYKSEDRITETSAAGFAEKMRTSGHHAMIEHASASLRIITDRGISHEIVRHRLASYAQESTRYCVAGDTVLSFKNPHHNMTIAGLYEKKVSSVNGAWKRLKIRQVDEQTGEIIFAKIRDIIKTGVKNVIEVKTKLGYSIKTTEDHLIKTECGYFKARNVLGTRIATNGTKELYKNQDWLRYHYNTLMKTAPAIAREFGFNESTIKAWVRKHKLPRKPRSYFNIGREPWNKGLHEQDDPRVKYQVNSLREHHWDGGNTKKPIPRKERIKKLSKCTYHKTVGMRCQICGTRSGLGVHHIDENREHNDESNLMTLCPSCHAGVHNKTNLVVYYDEVLSVTPLGSQDVYDIEMASDNHNFIANGICVHNCNYTKDKFEGQITVICPLGIAESSHYEPWYAACELAESIYLSMIHYGIKPEIARSVLPTCLKTEIVMTANFREWRHFIQLRGSKAAHPQIRSIARDCLNLLMGYAPNVFGDLVGLFDWS